MSIRTVVFGSAGYVGGELLRLLDAHPEFALAAAVSNSQSGIPIETVFPHLASAYQGQTFTQSAAWLDSISDGEDVALFSAAPHGKSSAIVAAALETAVSRNLNVHAVDSSADFRYDSAEEFQNVYGATHNAPELLDQFICAVPEHADGKVAVHAGHPGCFATATLLAAAPLVKEGIAKGDLFVTGITGSTGSGQSPRPVTHHPQRHSNLYTYQPLTHRHIPEIEALLGKISARETKVHFVPHSGPFARGIHITLQCKLGHGVSAEDVREIFQSFYENSPFVRLVSGTPRLKDVVASNFSHIGMAVSADSLAVMCVIDNLVKGAAGGAVQWMNRLWSLPESTGLLAAAPAWT